MYAPFQANLLVFAESNGPRNLGAMAGAVATAIMALTLRFLPEYLTVVAETVYGLPESYVPAPVNDRSWSSNRPTKH